MSIAMNVGYEVKVGIASAYFNARPPWRRG
jgi:hypothetical protein